MTFRLMCSVTALLAVAIPALAQKTAVVPAPVTLSYADVADLALPAPIVAQVRIRKAERLKAELAGNVVPTLRRYLITADIVALIRGREGLPPRVAYVFDVAPDARGKWPKLEKSEAIVFALPVVGRPAEIRLTAPDAQQPASPTLATLIRSLLNESASTSAPPRILGVGDAFHVEGTVAGEGETQIFLKAADGRPLSLSVWRQPGADRWQLSRPGAQGPHRRGSDRGGFHREGRAAGQAQEGRSGGRCRGTAAGHALASLAAARPWDCRDLTDQSRPLSALQRMTAGPTEHN